MNTPRASWAQAARIGVVAALVAVFIALIGMIEALSARDVIGGVVDMGRVLVLMTFFLAGHFALAQTRAAPLRSPGAVMRAALAGLITAVGLALLLLLLSALPQMRDVFTNATPKLVERLTFGQSLEVGILVLLGAGALIGGLAGLLRYLPDSIRVSLLGATTWVILVGLLQELLTVTFQNLGPVKEIASSFFGRSGLTIPGAVIVFVVMFTGQFVQIERGKQIQARLESLPLPQRRLLTILALSVVLVVLLSLPMLLGLFFSETLVTVGLYVLLGLGLNIVVGFAGLLDLGYAGFYAVGAYTLAILTSTSTEIVFAGGLPFWTALPIAIGVTLIAGIFLGIPVLKVRGDYLAIVTLGFAEIIRFLVLSDFLKPVLGGSRGVELIPKPFIGSYELGTPQQLYYLLLAGCLLVAFLSSRLKDSRVGRAWMAMREDEDVAQAMGINPVTTKLLAFAMGASFAGIGGAIFASKLAIIYPSSFNILVSINTLALLIIGGMGSIPGVIVGALVLVGLPELLREFQDYRLLIYGAVLVLMMLLRPEGLWPEAARRRELHEAEELAKASGEAVAAEEASRESQSPSVI